MKEATAERPEKSPSRARPARGGATAEALLASVLLVLALPVFLFSALVILASDGRPVLYRGRRLGLHKLPFEMLKFRTLRRGAHAVIGAQVYSDHHPKIVGLLTPFGKFLRDTRLDELPQLVNIVRGEMSFVGPRPERPEVFAAIIQSIPGAHRRFDVKPGLVGYAQLFTPHGSPKKLRVRFTNRFLARNLKQSARIGLALYTVWRVFILVLRKLGRFRPGGARAGRLERVRGATVFLTSGRLPDSGSGQGELVAMNRQVFVMTSPHQLRLNPGTDQPFKLRLEWTGRAGIRKRKVVACTGRVVETGGTEPGRYLVEYQTHSEMNQYLCEQYFLGESIARAHR